MPDAQCIRGRACRVESTRVSHHGHTGITRHSPRNGFTVSFVISPVIGFLATVALRITPRDLTPAPRRQDHTTSPSASGTLVSGTIRVHRIPPRVRDDREPPLCETGRQRI